MAARHLGGVKAAFLAFAFAACGWRPAGADQVGTSSCTGGECTQLKSPLITGVYPTSGSPCGGTKLTIYGEHFLMPSGENPWDSQTVFVGTKECHIHAHYTNSTQIFCVIENTDKEACFSLAGDDRAVAVVVTIWGGMGDYTQTLLEDAFTYRSDEALKVTWASSWSATNGDVICLSASDSASHRRRREHRRRRWYNPSPDHLNVTIGDTYCQMDWCESMYDSEDECGVSYATCMAQHAGNEKKQKGCEANANYCRWYDESCQPILRDGSEWTQFTFCCKVADSAEVGPGNYHLGVYVAPASAGGAGNGHGDSSCSQYTPWYNPDVLNDACTSVDTESGESFNMVLLPELSRVSPEYGGLHGGNPITVHGSGFLENCHKTEVTIGGIPCQCVSSTIHTIVCQPGEWRALETSELSGLIWERFSQSGGNKLGYKMGGVKTSPIQPNNGASSGHDYYIDEFTGFFVPPYNASFSFYVAGDDTASVQISRDEDFANLATVAYNAHHLWWYYNSDVAPWAWYFLRSSNDGEGLVGSWKQVSEPIYMEAGRKYAFRAKLVDYSSLDFIRLGMQVDHLSKAVYPNGTSIGSVADAIKKNHPFSELQVLKLQPTEDFTYETWSFSFDLNADPPNFRLRLRSAHTNVITQTGDILVTESVEDIKEKIRDSAYTVSNPDGTTTSQSLKAAVGCDDWRAASFDTGNMRHINISIHCHMPESYVSKPEYIDSIIHDQGANNDAVVISGKTRQQSMPLSGSFRYKCNGVWSETIAVRRGCYGHTNSELQYLARDVKNAAPEGCDIHAWPSPGPKYDTGCAEIVWWEVWIAFGASFGDTEELKLDNRDIAANADAEVAVWTARHGDPDSAFMERIPSSYFKMPDPTTDSQQAVVQVKVNGLLAASSTVDPPLYSYVPSRTPSLLSVSPSVLIEGDTLVLCTANLPVGGRGCANPEDMILVDPAEDKRSYSSVFNDEPPGTGHARSSLASPQAWSAKHNNHYQWMSIDLDDVVDVAGVVTRARGNYAQWVTLIEVQYSRDGSAWSKVPGSFSANTDELSEVRIVFPEPVSARYVRIHPLSWKGHMSMRAGVLTCDAVYVDMTEPLNGSNVSWLDDITVMAGDTSCTSLEDVTFDGMDYGCPASTNRTLTCRMTNVCAGFKSVSLLSAIQGYTDPDQAREVKLDADLTHFSPTFGSMAGGTALTISGTGIWCYSCSNIFVGGRPALEVTDPYWLVPGSLPEAGNRAHLPLDKTTSSRDSLTCLVPSLNVSSWAEMPEDQEVEVAIYQPQKMVLGTYTYMASMTPIVQTFSPDSPSSAVPTEVVVEGSGFEGASPYVWFGTRICDYTSHVDSSVRCWLQRATNAKSVDCQIDPSRADCQEAELNPGYSDAHVWVPSKGFAALNATFESKYEIQNVTPTLGSPEGGAEICLDGAGFEPQKLLDSNSNDAVTKSGDVGVTLIVLTPGKHWLEDEDNYPIGCDVMPGATAERICVRCGAPIQSTYDESRRLQLVEEMRVVEKPGDECTGGANDKSKPHCFLKAMMRKGALKSPVGTPHPHHNHHTVMRAVASTATGGSHASSWRRLSTGRHLLEDAYANNETNESAEADENGTEFTIVVRNVSSTMPAVGLSTTVPATTEYTTVVMASTSTAAPLPCPCPVGIAAGSTVAVAGHRRLQAMEMNGTSEADETTTPTSTAEANENEANVSATFPSMTTSGPSTQAAMTEGNFSTSQAPSTTGSTCYCIESEEVATTTVMPTTTTTALEPEGPKEYSTGCTKYAMARVKVMMDGLRASCLDQEGGCEFTFCREMSMQMLGVTPNNGSYAPGVDTVTYIEVESGAWDLDPSNTEVFFGEYQCEVTEARNTSWGVTTLTVPICVFPASTQPIYVRTPFGYVKDASPHSGASFFFTQNLAMNSASPDDVSRCGGAEVTVTGFGFAPRIAGNAGTGVVLYSPDGSSAESEPEPETEPGPEPESEPEPISEDGTITYVAIGGAETLVTEVYVGWGPALTGAMLGPGAQEPEPEPEAEAEPESESEAEPEAEPEPETEPEPEPESEWLPCEALDVSDTHIRCVVPTDLPVGTIKMRVRVVDVAKRTSRVAGHSGLDAKYYVPSDATGTSPALTQVEPTVAFDKAWASSLTDSINFGSETSFVARLSGMLYITQPGLYTFRVESDATHALWVDNVKNLEDSSSTGAVIATTGVSKYLFCGPHFLSLRFEGARDSDKLGLTLTYSGPDTGEAWMPVPQTVLSPEGPGQWRELQTNWGIATDEMQPKLLSVNVDDDSSSLTLGGTSFGNSTGLVTIGAALRPDSNFQCAINTWSDSSVTCSFGMLPAGSWQVRVLTDSGYTCGDVLSFDVAANVSSVSEWGGATTPAELQSGFAGGAELTLTGTNLGTAAGQMSVSVCGKPCTVTQSSLGETQVVTPAYTLAEVVETFPTAFPYVNLASVAGATFYTDDRDTSGTDWSVESDRSWRIFIGNREDQLLTNYYSGATRFRELDCYFAFELPPEKEALVYEVAIFPPNNPERRNAMDTSEIQIKNFDDVDWTTIVYVADIPNAGYTIQSGWSVFQFGSNPFKAQQFRIKLLGDLCKRNHSMETPYPSSYAGELLHSLHFDGVVLDKGSPVCDINLEEVRHPLALAPWSEGMELGQIRHDVNLTPVLSCETTPNQGTARGGTTVRTCGSGLAPLVLGEELLGEGGASYAKVWFNGYECAVTETNDTSIECVTGIRSNGITPSSVEVRVAGKGSALIVGMEDEKWFHYIDKWSDPLSWVNSNMPEEGDSVVVPLGQAILLDKNSGILFLLLIEGYMEFDRKDLTLEATYIWICGGHLRVGSENQPFMDQAVIKLYGDRWYTIELPYIGAKMLVVTNKGGLGGGCHQGGSMKSEGSQEVPASCQVDSVGKLDLHGRPDTSWTRLVRTANPGDTRLHLAEPVAWLPGSQVVITPSHYGHKEEVRFVESVEDGGFTVVLTQSVNSEHLGTWYHHPDMPGPTDLRAAVGLQTKTIRIQANESALFPGNDFLFGAHVATFFGGEMRIENTEFTMTGQAANFGRYSSHWHNLAPGRNVDMLPMGEKAYLRNNSYHDTFQRATVIHGVDYAVVKDCVAHKTHGHSFFTEAGDEDWVLFEHNLGVNPLPHHLLLQDDTDPACFWMPGFTGIHKHNLAANCVRGWRLQQVDMGVGQGHLEFFNNSAHACKKGWHVKPPNVPVGSPETYFYTFIMFRCEQGMFYYGTGNLVHEDHRFVECGNGFFMNHFLDHDFVNRAPFFLDSYVVGNTELDLDGVGAGQYTGSGEEISPTGTSCWSRTWRGFRWAKDEEEILFSGITAIYMCYSHVMTGCFKKMCTMRSEKFKPIHSYVYTMSDSGKSGIFWDMDGTLTGWPNGFVVMDVDYLHIPGLCYWDDIRHRNGVVCGSPDGALRLRKLELFNPSPWQMYDKTLQVKTQHGEDTISWYTETYSWSVPVVSYINHSSGECSETEYSMEALDVGINNFEVLTMKYSHAPYIWYSHGYNHHDYGYYRTVVEPVDEGVTVHLNFSMWRDHFNVDTGTRLRRKPSTCSDSFGSHSMMLWKHRCDEYDFFEVDGNITVDPDGCNAHPAPTCGGGTQDLCYSAEECAGDSSLPTECGVGGYARCRACGNQSLWNDGGCPASQFEMGVSRGACNGGYTNETEWELKKFLETQPWLNEVPGRFTSILNAEQPYGSGQPWNLHQTLYARVCPEPDCPTPPPAPPPPPTTYIPYDYKSWSDPANWGGTVPGHEADVNVNFMACLDTDMGDDGSLVMAKVTVVLGAALRLDNCVPPGSDGRRLQGGPTSVRLNVKNLVVWGALEIGHSWEPLPPSVTAIIAFYGGLWSQSVVVTNDIPAMNKAMIVLGSLDAYGSPVGSATAWLRLEETAYAGAEELVVRGNASNWPLGMKVGISATEYPLSSMTTETEMATINSTLYDEVAETTVIYLNSPLVHTHFAGTVKTPEMDGHWDRIELRAYVTLLEGRSNIIFTTGESDEVLASGGYTYEDSVGHGGTLVVGEMREYNLFGRVTLKNLDFIRMGKYESEHPALWFYYTGNFAPGELWSDDHGSSVEACVFSQNFGGGVSLKGVGAAPLALEGNVFHSVYRFAIWAVGPGLGKHPGHECKDDVIIVRNNLAMETKRHPLSQSSQHNRPFASFLLEVRMVPGTFIGNVAAGSGDNGFVLRVGRKKCHAGPEPTLTEPSNEAVGCLTGFFILQPHLHEQSTYDASDCVVFQGALAWKNAHIGLLTVDQTENLYLDSIAVSDNHIGIALRFLPGMTTNHRVYGHNLTIFGSTPASSCSKSTVCMAIQEGAFTGEECRSVMGPSWRRVGMLAHMTASLRTLCEGDSKLPVCEPPITWKKACAGPMEHRRGSLGALYSEAQWTKVTFGYFKEDDCDKKSVAFSFNPTSADLSGPNVFSNVKWLSNIEVAAKFRLKITKGNPTNTNKDCHSGECDGLQQLAVIDADGSLLAGPENASVISTTAVGVSTADECFTPQGGNYLQCSLGSGLALNQFTWMPVDHVAHRAFGVFKSQRMSDERENPSFGPYKEDECIMADAPLIRNFLVRGNEVYNLTFFQSPPKNHKFYYFNDRPECLEIRLRLSQPFAFQFYINGKDGATGLVALKDDDWDTAKEEVPRYPTIGDEHGKYAFDPQDRTLFFTICGGGTFGPQSTPQSEGGGFLYIELIQVVQLSLTVSVDAEDFDQDAQTAFIDNVALLLQIPSYRIKIVGVQGVRRRLQEESVQTPVAETSDDPDARRRLGNPVADGDTVLGFARVGPGRTSRAHPRRMQGPAARRLAGNGTTVILQILEDQIASGNMTNGTNDTDGSSGSTDSLDELNGIADAVVAAVEDGSFEQSTGYDTEVEEVVVTDPDAPAATSTTTTTTTTTSLNITVNDTDDWGTLVTVATTEQVVAQAMDANDSETSTVAPAAEVVVGDQPENEDGDAVSSIGMVVGAIVGTIAGVLGMMLGLYAYRHPSVFGIGRAMDAMKVMPLDDMPTPKAENASPKKALQYEIPLKE